MTAFMQHAATAAVGSFDIRLLGPFQVQFEGTSLDTGSWRPQVARLFRLIVSTPELRRSSDDIIELLWPDALPEAGARNLDFALHMLRRTLTGNPSPISSEHGWVVLTPAYEWRIDAHRFADLAGGARNTESLAVEDLCAALSLFAGDPLPEDRYEDWALPIIERLESSNHRQVAGRGCSLPRGV